jgi:glycine/D-amino acid oxidase-like deaminating enzyme
VPVNAPSSRSAASRSADVIIIGGGVIGLSTAIELSRSGATGVLVDQTRHGAASNAAAGLLAPSIGHLDDSIRKFFFASLDLFPSYLAPLTCLDPALSIIAGLIDVSTSHADRQHDDNGRQLTPSELHAIDPGLLAPRGARLFERDGAIDNVRLVAALRLAIAGQSNVRTVTDDPVIRIAFSPGQASVQLESGNAIRAGAIVLAAGAWSPLIGGLPRSVPVTPLKGQMLAVSFGGLQHPISGDEVYLVPRTGEVVIGATAEAVGFDPTVHADATERLRLSAASICPALGSAPVTRTWAGLRPATPDLQPILGPDPEEPRLIYACGHSKNGILLAPATAVATVALVQHRTPAFDLEPFSILRFAHRREAPPR